MPRDGTATRERILDQAQRLIVDRGFAATSVDAVLAEAGVTKGAFFHHFPSKADLARALVDRYAAADVAALEDIMGRAEAESDDPARQVVAFVRLFEEDSDELASEQPGCLYVSFVYEKQLFEDGTNDVIVDAVVLWRDRLREKLEAACAVHPPRIDVDLETLADQVFTVFEGGFILARTMRDPTRLRTQLTHLRHYLELLFGLEPANGRF
ncbi:MAG TPA: helix-turn-helix domain-containing protein [Gaiellaceae bacterium]|jgi:TetR/AcrR family transcriptional repressor of nem operon|nr:helix-turn-helix domain-containing protein [Gaiellaceae bacterium]